MILNQFKVPVVLAGLLAIAGIGAFATTGAQGTARKQATRPQAPQRESRKNILPPQVPPDELVNVPRDAFPIVDDKDATAKIQAARDAYDAELQKLSSLASRSRAEVEFLSVQIDARKARLLKNATEQLEAQNRLRGLTDDEKPIGLAEREAMRVKGLQRESDELRQSLRALLEQLENLRAESDEAEARLQALKRRPRPVEKVVVQPGDWLRIEVLEALPGRPISGDRWVQPDGMVSLEFYGQIYVVGLTAEEIKEKVILKLRKFLPDATLGLVEVDPENERKHIINQPKDSDRVFVEIVPEGVFSRWIDRREGPGGSARPRN